jgi:hypothetical protein
MCFGAFSTLHKIIGIPAEPRALVIPTSFQLPSMAKAVPVGIGVANPDECCLGRPRGVGIVVSTVCTHHDEKNMAVDRAKNKRMHG